MSIKKAVSLFSGAGGMDVGFVNAGYDIRYANEKEKTFCETYESYFGIGTISHGDVSDKMNEIKKLKDIDIVFGGPPCQGFSVAGKMNPDDLRSDLVWTYLDIVGMIQPKVFLMENVRALAELKKWEQIRNGIIEKASSLGYSCFYVVLNASDYGVPQKRERVFFIGSKNLFFTRDDFLRTLTKYQVKAKTVRETFSKLGKIGSESNPSTCVAKISLLKNPVLRKSPYSGMLLNGRGRPINLDSYSPTLTASMGGGATPIVDQMALDDPETENWFVGYLEKLRAGEIDPRTATVPSHLRRISLVEAAALQTFPIGYPFKGAKSVQYKQIGNAVPCSLAEALAKAVEEECF